MGNRARGWLCVARPPPCWLATIVPVVEQFAYSVLRADFLIRVRTHKNCPYARIESFTQFCLFGVACSSGRKHLQESDGKLSTIASYKYHQMSMSITWCLHLLKQVPITEIEVAIQQCFCKFSKQDHWAPEKQICSTNSATLGLKFDYRTRPSSNLTNFQAIFRHSTGIRRMSHFLAIFRQSDRDPTNVVVLCYIANVPQKWLHCNVRHICLHGFSSK